MIVVGYVVALIGAIAGPAWVAYCAGCFEREHSDKRATKGLH